jgi:hypothetical protein
LTAGVPVHPIGQLLDLDLRERILLGAGWSADERLDDVAARACCEEDTADVTVVNVWETPAARGDFAVERVMAAPAATNSSYECFGRRPSSNPFMLQVLPSASSSSTTRVPFSSPVN